jgi:hypothetical protein
MDRALMMLLSGFIDALNPCALTTVSIFGLSLFIFRGSRYLLRAFAAPFLLAYFLMGFEIQAGWGVDLFTSMDYVY